MVEYSEEGIFPYPRTQVWKLLDAHLDDAQIVNIHSLIRAQKTLKRSANEALVERTIDARGKLMDSQWKISMRPPEFYRWEVVSGDGPYAPGSFIESQYSDASGGTRMRTHVKARITVLPFFLPQKTVLQRVLSDIDEEDRAYLKG